MAYAIIEASGKQLWIETGKFYDINYINGEPGDIIQFNRVLLKNKKGKIEIGQPCIHSAHIKAEILKHLKGKKVTVFKMKSKKNSRTKQGHRQKLTRLLIKEISD
uniref:Large ribosomal subunit protein bL21c n=1 Tax=Pterocladia lucida TaxID=31408 RepID=A0A6M3WWZ7_PTELU|nr:ribosomal protein L21 [Pterocladia lucida]